MIVTVGDNKLDLDNIYGPADIIKFADEMIGVPSPTGKNEGARNSEIIFDEVTQREQAIKNLIIALDGEYVKLRKKLFPSSTTSVVAAARAAGKPDLVNLPAIDFEEYATMQKLNYCCNLLQHYIAFLVQARIGFGLSARITDGGKVYVLEDLRELYSRL